MYTTKQQKPQQSRVIQNENKNHVVQMKRGKSQGKLKERREQFNLQIIAEEDGIRRRNQFHHNWKKLNYRDYLKQHGLTLAPGRPIKSSPGKLVLRVTDGSVIIIDIKGKYWRHESAYNEGAYYDNNHIINPNNEQTHFSLI